MLFQFTQESNETGTFNDMHIQKLSRRDLLQTRAPLTK